MDVHNISYLHDDNAPQDSMPEDKISSRTNFLTKRNIILASTLGIFLISTTVITLNISRPQTTTSNANETTDPSTAAITPKPVIVEGTIECLDPSQKENPRCELALKTDDGKTYTIDDSEASKNLTVGQRVKLEGDVLDQTQTLTTKAKTILQVTKIQSPTTNTTTKTPTPTSSTSSSNDTPLPTATPTPTPQLKNNTPNPGVDYVTVKYVVDNKNILSGQNVNVSAFLVGGYIGRSGCDFEPDCDKSLFILNDTASTDRNTNYDVGLRGGTTDQEGEYAPGQNYYTTAKVIVSGDTVSLEKIN